MRLRATLLGALTAAVLAVGTASAPAALAAGSGQIDGTITDTSGAPVGTCVYVYDTGYSYAGSACTDPATGAYVVDGLTDGTAYRLDVQSDGVHAEQWFDGANSFDSATDVVAPGTADVVLAEAATLTGTLTDANGSPIIGALVYFSTLDGGYAGSGSTGPSGMWFTTLPAGQYKIEFWHDGATMWYLQSHSFETADVVTGVAGETTTLDAQFEPQGSVSGTVTDASTGEPISGVCAAVVDPGTWSPTSSPGSNDCTDADGHYLTYVDTPGTYTVQFIDGAGRYAGTFAGGTRDITRAAEVTVGATGDVTADAVMQIGAVITGKAVESRTGKPVAEVQGTLFDGILDQVTGVYPYVWGTTSQASGADGIYRISAVPTGSATLLLTPAYRSGYAQEWYAGAATQAKATTVSVTAPRATNLKDTRFLPGGTVSGTVTDEAGNPIAGAWVDLDGYYPGRAGPGEGIHSVQTDENGHYSFVAPEGKYPAMAYEYGGDHAPTWNGGAVTRATASLVNVKPLRTTTLNFVMKPGAHVNGTLVKADGSEPSGYFVGYVYTAAGDPIGYFDAFADNNWAINTTALPAGDFLLKAQTVDPDTGQIASTAWYDGKTTQSTATVVHLTTGETKETTFHLP